MRDFLYNKGDVLIAVLIIVVAVVVIYFRVGVVMGNTDPLGELQQLLPSAPQTGQTDNSAAAGTTNAANGDASQGDATAPAAIAPDVTGTTDVTGATGDQATQTPAVTGTSDAQATNPDQGAQASTPPAQTPTTTAKPAKPAPGSVDTQITVSAGDAASTIADKLYAVGAISDQQAFLSEVIAQKADSKLKQGTFTIPAGSTMSDIVKILVG